MPADALYDGREQSYVKHFILRGYLRDFAHKVGFGWDTITYVDCFSGPWNVRSEKLDDSSFAIALSELHRAQSTLADHNRQLRLRCFFLEKKASSYRRLAAYASSVKGAEVETRNKSLEEAIEDIQAFIQAGGARAFPFIFIDPTGWSGLDMAVIRPLLQVSPGEVLINFMTGHIRRFVESPHDQILDSINRFFGSAARVRVAAFHDPQDREDGLFREYAEQVKRVGEYAYVCVAVVLHPTDERTCFHLIYATRSPEGVEVFKGVERRAMPVMEQKRSGAKHQKQVNRTGQRELYGPEVSNPGQRLTALRERYLAKARHQAESALRVTGVVLYDHLWAEAMSWPLVWDSDVKSWLKKWRDDGSVALQGMKAKQRAPKVGDAIQVVWKQSPGGRQKTLFDA